jgi:hypothetical protein
MTFLFSSNQISGFAIGTSGFTLNNPLSFTASRIDSQNDEIFEVILYSSSGTEFTPQTILTGSEPTDGHSISEIDLSTGSTWIESEGQTIRTSAITQAGILAASKMRKLSSIFNVGQYKLKIKSLNETYELEPVQYETSANRLVATFANGVKIQLSSPNTVIQIPSYAINLTWANGEWAQGLKYSQTNYQKSIQTIATAQPFSLPTGDNVAISAPLEIGDKIMVAYQFNATNSIFGVDSANPLIIWGEDTQSYKPKTIDEWENSYFPSYTELINAGLSADYPWYAAVIENPDKAEPNNSQNSQAFYYLNGLFGVDRDDQYDKNLINGTLNDLDPYERYPDVVGVDGDLFGNFEFQVTMLVPKDKVFRPKGGGYKPDDPTYTDFQKVDNTTPGPLEGFSLGNDGRYSFEIPAGQEIEFYNPEIGQGLLETVPNSGESLSFSEWYKNWWVSNTLSGEFPWTGRGYTYDPYYPTNQGWDEFPALGPGVGELVQSLRPENANKTEWMYEILDVQTIPEALGAKQQPTSGSWSLNIKKLGRDDATVYIYEADSVTGLLVKSLKKNEQGDAVPLQYLYPNDGDYLEAAKDFAVQTLRPSELPEWGEESNYNLGELKTGTNYGIVVEVNGNLFGTYGATSEQFISLSNPDSMASLSIGFEDTSLIEGGDNDFNDLIFTLSNSL